MENKDRKQMLLDVLLKDVPETEDVTILFTLLPNIEDVKSYTYTQPILELRLSSILYTDKEYLAILNSFGFPFPIIHAVEVIIEHLSFELKTEKNSVEKFLNTFPEDQLHSFFALKRAIALKKNHIEKIYEIDTIEEYVQNYIMENNHITKNKLNISYTDLESIGFSKEEINQFINKVISLIKKKKLENTYEALLNYAYKAKGENF